MAKWLVKSEPNTYSIDDLRREKSTIWDGVRNYQARNFMREMKVGEAVFIYHSVSEPIGIVGLARVCEGAAPDPTQFDKKSRYFDSAATQQAPRWYCPRLEFVKKFRQIVPLQRIKSSTGLENMVLLRPGSRLSVQPVAEKEYAIIIKLSESN